MLRVTWLVNDRDGCVLNHTVLLMGVWGEGLTAWKTDIQSV